MNHVEVVIASTAAVMALRVKKSEKRKNCEESKETVTRLSTKKNFSRDETIDGNEADDMNHDAKVDDGDDVERRPRP